MVYGILLIVLGVIASPSLFLTKHPNGQKILNKITPYQGWIGIIFLLIGIFGIINTATATTVLRILPMWWITAMAGYVIEAALGFILGYAMINKFILSKNEEAKKKGEQLIAKLAPIQAKLGLLGIAIGVWTIIATIVYLR
ncbi:MAG: hypothetical protein N4A72_23250 [Bacteroidales bacterium]|jgi:hypothetical protein|nr:hypothetical protein [Bacteroidales bacterium]